MTGLADYHVEILQTLAAHGGWVKVSRYSSPRIEPAHVGYLTRRHLVDRSKASGFRGTHIRITESGRAALAEVAS